jgi:lysophospholipase L1-like esterase
MIFIGDSMTWGYNVEASERFSDLLRSRLNYNVLNAGVSGFGTDQAFLLLKRLWNDVAPSVVVLIFCVENDHTDNSRNLRYFNYKPYLHAAANGGWEFRGQPPPIPRKARFKENWLARQSILVRLAISGYVELAYPRVTVPDPTEPLITMLRDNVTQRGAKLLVGVQEADPPLEAFLQRQGIPFARFDGAEYYDSSRHWTPAGHALVAERLAELFAAQNISAAAPAQ